MHKWLNRLHQIYADICNFHEPPIVNNGLIEAGVCVEKKRGTIK